MPSRLRGTTAALATTALLVPSAALATRGGGGDDHRFARWPPCGRHRTGGTGRYRGVAGEVQVRQLSEKTEDYVVRLHKR
jgi:hypothetical protein